MMLEQEKDELNLTQTHLQGSHGVEAQPVGSAQPWMQDQKKVRHVYLQEENSYGRFVPFLLLKDKLHSQIDSSGSSALIHMCSHNSPYIPLYLSTLKQGDPILNRATNLGHTPLDVAGMYCRREYVDMLREKGAIDDGRVDAWAIQGANIANWSGKVDPAKKALIHWAAFNNFPQVLQKYYEAGANVDERDERGNTPIDMAVANKSYQSVQVLARLGFRPQQTVLQKSDSPYLMKLFSELDRSPLSILIEKSLKMSLVPVLLLSQFVLVENANFFTYLPMIVLYAFLVSMVPGADSVERPTAFFSSLVNQKIVYGFNHLAYVMLMLLMVWEGIVTVFSLQVTSFWLALYFWVVLVITGTFGVNLSILLYGVLTNTTPSEMFESHKNPQLWRKIDYLTHKNIVMRVYKNPNRGQVKENLRYYWNYRRPQ